MCVSWGEICQCAPLLRHTEGTGAAEPAQGKEQEQGSRHCLSLAPTSHIFTAEFYRSSLLSKSNVIAPESRSEAFSFFGKQTGSSFKYLPVTLVLKCFPYKIQHVILQIVAEIEAITNQHQYLMGMFNESNILVN